MKKEEVKFESTGKATELVHRTEIPGSPFTAVKLNGSSKAFLAIGMQKLTEDIFNNIDEVMEYINENKWNIIMQFCMLTAKFINDNKEN